MKEIVFVFNIFRCLGTFETMIQNGVHCTTYIWCSYSYASSHELCPATASDLASVDQFLLDPSRDKQNTWATFGTSPPKARDMSHHLK